MKTYLKEDFQGFDDVFRRNFFNTLSGPKPCWLMGTRHENGRPNFGLFSNVIHVGAQPPAIGILFRPLTVARHSWDNLHREEQCALSLVHRAILGGAHQLSAPWDMDTDEAKVSGLAMENWKQSAVIKDSPVQLLCKPVETLTLQWNQTQLQVLAIEEVRIQEGLVAADGLVDMVAADAIACLGLDAYLQVMPAARFRYAKTDRPLSPLEWFKEAESDR